MKVKIRLLISVFLLVAFVFPICLNGQTPAPAGQSGIFAGRLNFEAGFNSTRYKINRGLPNSAVVRTDHIGLSGAYALREWLDVHGDYTFGWVKLDKQAARDRRNLSPTAFDSGAGHIGSKVCPMMREYDEGTVAVCGSYDLTFPSNGSRKVSQLVSNQVPGSYLAITPGGWNHEMGLFASASKNNLSGRVYGSLLARGKKDNIVLRNKTTIGAGVAWKLFDGDPVKVSLSADGWWTNQQRGMILFRREMIQETGGSEWRIAPGVNIGFGFCDAKTSYEIPINQKLGKLMPMELGGFRVGGSCRF